MTTATSPRAWRMLALIAVAELLGMSVWFAANAVAPQLVSRWHLSASEAGWLSTVVQFGFVAGTAFVALLNLADTLDSRTIFSVSALAAAAANACLLFTPTYRWTVACRAVTGFFLAGVYPPAMKMASTWFRERRGLAIGIVVGALTIGKALPYLIHALAGADLRAVVAGASLAAVTGAVLIAVAYVDGPAPFPRRPFKAALVADVLRNRNYREVLGGYGGHMLELYACWIWIPAFLAASAASRGLSTEAAATQVNLLSFAVIASGAVGCVVGGELADRIGHVRLVVGAMTVSGLSALLTPFVFGRSTWLVTLLLFVWSISVIADSAQFSTLVTRVVPSDTTGTALTLQTSIGFLLTTITIQLVPLLVTRVGWQYAFPVLALGPAIGIAAIRRLRVPPVI